MLATNPRRYNYKTCLTLIINNPIRTWVYRIIFRYGNSSKERAIVYNATANCFNRSWDFKAFQTRSIKCPITDRLNCVRYRISAISSTWEKHKLWICLFVVDYSIFCIILFIIFCNFKIIQTGTILKSAGIDVCNGGRDYNLLNIFFSGEGVFINRLNTIRNNNQLGITCVLCQNIFIVYHKIIAIFAFSQSI